MLSQFKNAKILSFGAHPDDIEIGCGGVELKLAAQGCEIYHAILTKGEEGSLTINKETLAKTRKLEALNAGEVIGAKSVHFFDYQDGLTYFSKEMKIEIIAHIRKIRPDIIFVHAPEDNQPDHQLSSKLVLDAMAAASGPWFPDAKGLPHLPKLVLGYEVWSPLPRPTMVINISKYLDKKIEAINKFGSQTHDIDYAGAIAGLASYRSLLTKDNQPAEAFQILFCTDF